MDLAKEEDLRRAIDDAVEGEDEADGLGVEPETAELDGRRVEHGLNGAQRDVDDGEEGVVARSDNDLWDEQTADGERALGIVESLRRKLRIVVIHLGFFRRLAQELPDGLWVFHSLGVSAVRRSGTGISGDKTLAYLFQEEERGKAGHQGEGCGNGTGKEIRILLEELPITEDGRIVLSGPGQRAANDGAVEES